VLISQGDFSVFVKLSTLLGERPTRLIVEAIRMHATWSAIGG
jgi:hypothetical protein